MPAENGCTPENPRDSQVRRALMCGYDKNPCPQCQQYTVVSNGAVTKCDTCGETTGIDPPSSESKTPPTQGLRRAQDEAARGELFPDSASEKLPGQSNGLDEFLKGMV